MSNPTDIEDLTHGNMFDFLRSDGQDMEMRLHGVDVPESEPYGKKASAVARRYVDGKTVPVTVDSGTIRAVEVGDGSLATMPGQDGLASHFDRFAPDATEFAKLERQTCNLKYGLWSQASPIPL